MEACHELEVLPTPRWMPPYHGMTYHTLLGVVHAKPILAEPLLFQTGGWLAGLPCLNFPASLALFAMLQLQAYC